MGLFDGNSNPTMGEKVFERSLQTANTGEVMTVRGTVNKTFLLFFLMLGPAIFTWRKFLDIITYNPDGAGAIFPWMIGGVIGSLVFALITTFAPKYSMYTAPLYALAEGLFLGAISSFFNYMYDGIVIQAVLLTLTVFGGMLVMYRTGIIKPTAKFKAIIIGATVGIGIFYLVLMVLGLFGVQNFYAGNSWLSIGISLFVVAIAALNLILDFETIETGVQMQAPKHMEWYCAFGIMVTLVWLYLEILRLLAKLSSRD